MYMCTRLQVIVLAVWLTGLLAVRPVSADIPAPEWSEPISPFCRQFLHACYEACFRANAKLRDKQGQPYPDSVLRLYCQRKCWNHPARRRLCKLSEQQLLRLAGQFEKNERKLLAREQALDQKRQQLERKRRRESERQQQLEAQKLRAKQRELLEQQRALAQAKKDLQAQQKQLNAQRRSQKAQKTFEEERKRFTLQKKWLHEEKKRLAAEKQRNAKQRVEEKKRRREEAARLAELNDLRKKRLAEVQRLKELRLSEQKRINALKKLSTEEARVAAQQQLLLKKQREALQQKHLSSLSTLRQQETALKAKVEQLKLQKQKLKQDASDSTRKRLARLKSLAALRKRAQRKRQYRRRRHRPYGVRLFCKGQVKSAMRWFAKRRRKRIVQKIRTFQSSFRLGQHAHNRRDPDTAIPELERALTLELEISASKSLFSRKIRRMLSNMYVSKGLLAMSQRSHSSAYIYFSVAKRHYRKHPTALLGLKQLAGIAKKIFKNAKRYEKTAPPLFRKHMRKVLQIVPKRSALYKKVSKLLHKSKGHTK